MDLRQLVRGTVDRGDVEAIAVALSEGDGDPDVELLEADNWLSTPVVVDGEWFVKVITAQNALVHAVLTGARNLGVFTSGTEGFFGRYAGPVEMARHELEATRRMRAIGVNAPEPVDAFEHDGLGVLVLEYLPDRVPIEELPDEELDGLARQVFDALARMHGHDLAHGDLRADNVIVVDGEPYFIDATHLREDGIADAVAYDVACALAVLAPRVGDARAVELAVDAYDVDTVLRAGRFLDFVNLRPDLAFDPALLKGEIEKAAST